MNRNAYLFSAELSLWSCVTLLIGSVADTLRAGGRSYLSVSHP